MASVDRRPLHLWFDHGLGDCTQFAQYLQLLRRRGYDIAVHFEENKGFLWRVAGIGYAPSEGAAHVGWTYRPDFNVPVATVDQSGNKVFGNFGRSPLPDLGDDKAVWDELCDTVELKARPFIGESALVDAKRLVEHLERPIVLLHSNGSNFQDAKDFPRTMLSELYRGLLDELECTLVLLDWDDRVPALRHGRVRHLRRDWGHLDLERLAAVMEESDLLIGVDSGPFHFASLSSIPSLGVFYGHYPSCVALPRSRAAMMTRNGEGYRDVNIKRRRRWNIVEYDGALPPPSDVVRHARRMVEGPRYLRSRARIGRDVQLQQWVRDWSYRRTPFSAYTDRNVTLDRLFRGIRSRFRAPQIVETGCIRAIEDWSAGYSTYLFSMLLDGLGSGSLTSIDRSRASLALAKEIMEECGQTVSFVEGDSVSVLAAGTSRIDVLYLDSLDVGEAKYQEHCLAEAKAAIQRLAKDSMILVDDTLWEGKWVGKGALAIPYLLSLGWKVLASGYQVLLSRVDFARSEPSDAVDEVDGLVTTRRNSL